MEWEKAKLCAFYVSIAQLRLQKKREPEEQSQTHTDGIKNRGNI